MTPEVGDGLARGDGEEERLGPRESGITSDRALHHLRLHRQDDDIGPEIGGDGLAAGLDTDALADEVLELCGIGLDHHAPTGRQPAGQPAAEHGPAHLPAADEKQPRRRQISHDAGTRVSPP